MCISQEYRTTKQNPPLWQAGFSTFGPFDFNCECNGMQTAARRPKSMSTEATPPFFDPFFGNCTSSQACSLQGQPGGTRTKAKRVRSRSRNSHPYAGLSKLVGLGLEQGKGIPMHSRSEYWNCQNYHKQSIIFLCRPS